ncbi:MAG: hypothetical protein LBD20_06245, partial [Spirochaetaceae bacterium]|nr:hypothetical protein [Spirochaetaceae bacterium]
MDSAMKPSILHAHTGIGSSDDIDKYGVWIKSEPEDWTETPDGFNLDTFDDFSDTRVHKKSLENSDDFTEIETEEAPQFPGDDDLIAEDGATAHGDAERQKIADANDDSLDEDPSFQASAPSAEQESTLKLEKLQTELLQTIANELTAIKREIESLKGEFSSIGKKEAAAPADDEGTAGTGKASGFFDDDDDDDVIVLTEEELVHLESDVTDIEAESESEMAEAEPAAHEHEDSDESIVKTEAETLSSGEISKMLDNAEIMTEPHDNEAAIVENDTFAEAAEQETAEEGGEMPADEALSSDELANIFNTADVVEEIAQAPELEYDVKPELLPEDEPLETELDPVLESNDLDAGLLPEEPEEIFVDDEEAGEPLEAIEDFDDEVEVDAGDDNHFSNVTVELEDEEKLETEDSFDPFEELETNLAGHPPEPEEELTIDAAVFSEPPAEAAEQIPEEPAAVETAITEETAAGGKEAGLNFTIEDFTPDPNEKAAAPPPFSLADIPQLPDFDTIADEPAEADTEQPEDAAELPDFDIAAEADAEQPEDAAELPDFDIAADADTEQPEDDAEHPDIDIAADADTEQPVDEDELA